MEICNFQFLADLDVLVVVKLSLMICFWFYILFFFLN